MASMLQCPNTNVHQEVKSHIKTAFKNNPIKFGAKKRTRMKGAARRVSQVAPPPPHPPFDKYMVSITTGEYLQRAWLESSIARSWVPRFSQQRSFIEMKIIAEANPCVWSSNPPER